jgi:predicted ATP-dependent endonuclease of OLD family
VKKDTSPLTASCFHHATPHSPSFLLIVLQPGTISRVLIRNVRCHANLELMLHPRINFIIGNNGSGKSSILFAIRLALGMKVDKQLSSTAKGGGAAASAAALMKKKTGRSKASETGVRTAVPIDSIVRKGSDGEAVAEVEMRNTGKDCLPQTQWGYMFTLRRTLKINKDTGKTEDKLDALRHVYYDSRGKEVKGDPFAPGVVIKEVKKEPVVHYSSRTHEPIIETAVKRAEWIQKMLEEHLHAFYNNPLMIMDQETSKDFVKGSAKAKYKFFMEGTGLQRNYDDLQDSVTKLANARASLRVYNVEVSIKHWQTRQREVL